MLDIWQFFSSYNSPTVVFCHFLFSSFRVVACLVRDLCIFKYDFIYTCPKFKCVKIHPGEKHEIFKSSNGCLFSSQSLLSPTAFSYASQYIARYEEQGIGRLLSVKVDFSRSRLPYSSHRNKCVCALCRSSVGKYVQLPGSGWHHLLWLAVRSDCSRLLHLFHDCLVRQECLPRYEHTSDTRLLFMVVTVMSWLISIF